jgi:hypothetical protein
MSPAGVHDSVNLVPCGMVDMSVMSPGHGAQPMPATCPTASTVHQPQL